MEAFGLELGFLADPRVGLPLLLLAAALLLWFLAGSPGEPRRSGRETPVREPDRDSVSRTYLAVRRESYSAVLLEVYGRLDKTLLDRTGRRLGQIPWRGRVAKSLGIPEPRELERTRIALDNLYVWAVRLETDSLLRRDFWRTWEVSRAVFLKRMAQRLGDVDRQLSLLGYVP